MESEIKRAARLLGFTSEDLYKNKWNILRDLYLDWRELGKDEGLREGYDLGYEQGYESGYENAMYE